MIAISASGTRYACHTGSRAPANKLVAPTGAKLDGCGSKRTIAPSTVSDKARGRQFEFWVINYEYRRFTAEKPVRQPCLRLKIANPTRPVPISKDVPASGTGSMLPVCAVPQLKLSKNA